MTTRSRTTWSISSRRSGFIEQPFVTQRYEAFFRAPPKACGSLTNERSLQLELAFALRERGWRVRFEVLLSASRLIGSTLRHKTYLDLRVERDGEVIGIELKVPLNGQHPETIYSFCADLEFLEAIKRERHVGSGIAIMVTHDGAFWRDSGRGSAIHNAFRSDGFVLTGKIEKPTGLRDSCIILEGAYITAGKWCDVGSALMPNGRYLLVDV